MAEASPPQGQFQEWVDDNIAGWISGSVSIIIGHPFDTIKVRLQAGHAQYAGAADCLRATVRAEGPRALFQGMLAPLISQSAMNAVTFRYRLHTCASSGSDSSDPRAAAGPQHVEAGGAPAAL